jgi:hypothetical protein
MFVRRTKTVSKIQTVALSNVKKTLPTVIVTLYWLLKSNGIMLKSTIEVGVEGSDCDQLYNNFSGGLRKTT